MQGHHKLRNKIGRSQVAKKMQRKFHIHVKDKSTASADDSDNGGARFTCASKFSRKSVGSPFSCVIGNKTPLGKHASKLKKKGSSNELGNNLASADEPVEAALSRLLALEETDRGGERKDRQRVKINLPRKLVSSLERKKGWKNAHGDGFGQVRKKASFHRLVRIPSKLLIVGLKWKMIRSLIKKKEKRQIEEGGGVDDDDRELCKKRILLGDRCRPLSSPGYGSYSFFLPRTQRHP